MINPVALFTLISLLAASPAEKPERVTLHGTVLTLSQALKSSKLPVDAEPADKQVVIKTETGELIPLLSNDASRALFLDARLQNRDAEVHALRHKNLPYLQVVSFKIRDQGKLRTPEYYCEICTIRVRFPQTCPCCQGEMVLRMSPESP